MPSYFYVLLRFHMRVDDVTMRIHECGLPLLRPRHTAVHVSLLIHRCANPFSAARGSSTSTGRRTCFASTKPARPPTSSSPSRAYAPPPTSSSISCDVPLTTQRNTHTH